MNIELEGCIIDFLWEETQLANKMKQFIMKFVNRKHSEAMLQQNEDINFKNKVFVTHSLCPYYRFFWGPRNAISPRENVKIYTRKEALLHFHTPFFIDDSGGGFHAD